MYTFVQFPFFSDTWCDQASVALLFSEMGEPLEAYLSLLWAKAWRGSELNLAALKTRNGVARAQEMPLT